MKNHSWQVLARGVWRCLGCGNEFESMKKPYPHKGQIVIQKPLHGLLFRTDTLRDCAEEVIRKMHES